MKLHLGDEIQIEGMHPINPITGEVIPAHLQIFSVTRVIEGATIPLDALHPRPDLDLQLFGVRVMATEPIAMQRIVRLNGVPLRGVGPMTTDRVRALVDQQAEDDGLWFAAHTAPEAYLQQALRQLHAAVEADDGLVQRRRDFEAGWDKGYMTVGYGVGEPAATKARDVAAYLSGAKLSDAHDR